jgi:hypothetical protein
LEGSSRGSSAAYIFFLAISLWFNNLPEHSKPIKIKHSKKGFSGTLQAQPELAGICHFTNVIPENINVCSFRDKYG